MRSTVAVLAAVSTLVASDQAAWRRAQPDYAWSFPADHWPHTDYKTEWWYFTGTLEHGGTPRFGFQFTVFKVGLTPQPRPRASDWSSAALFMGHAAITDLTTGNHRFAEVVYRPAPFLAAFADPPDSVIAWSRAAPGTDGRWQLAWNGDGFSIAMRDDVVGFAIDLVTTPIKPLVLQGPNGYSLKTDTGAGASMYYSFPRMSTNGTITVDGTAFPVRGTSWMDKEFSSDALGDEQVGWDWFGLRLDDGRDLMLYRLRAARGADHVRRGTIVRADGTRDVLASGAWTLRAAASWDSPHTDATYPTEWTIEIEDRTLTVRAVAPDQENVSRLVDNLYYWEGAVEVFAANGVRIGEGYAELTGYGSAGPPAI